AIALSSFIVPTSTDIYSLPLHDALPISHEAFPDCVPARRPGGERSDLGQLYAPKRCRHRPTWAACSGPARAERPRGTARGARERSEEHTSELQSLTNLVCRLLLAKKTKN